MAHTTSVGVGAGTVVADVHGETRGVGVDGAGGCAGRACILRVEQLTVDVGGDLTVTFDGHGHMRPLALGKLSSRAVKVQTRGGFLLEVPLDTPITVGSQGETEIAAAAPVLVTEDGWVACEGVELDPHGHGEISGVAEKDVGRCTQSDEVGKGTVLGVAAEDGLAKLAGRVGGFAHGGAVVGLGRGVSGIAIESQVRDQAIFQCGLERH